MSRFAPLPASESAGIFLTVSVPEGCAMKVLLGSKVGMTQVCNAEGAFSAVTVLHVGPCEVLAARTRQVHGYDALQLGYAGQKQAASKEEGGSVKSVGSARFIREVPAIEGASVGSALSVDILNGVAKVDVVGTSKGRGFAGVIKRHNFGGVCASHGVKKVHRSGGSTGQSTDPGRVFKGTKMPGRMGGVRVTVKSLRVFSVVANENLLLVSGAVPGFSGGNVMVREVV